MAWFAQLIENNTVNQVVFAVDGIDKNKMSEMYGGVWVETYENGSTKKHFASIGFTYDSGRDAFIPPKPFESWLLNEETCLWYPPVSYPTDGRRYFWNEQNQQWDEIA